MTSTGCWYDFSLKRPSKSGVYDIEDVSNDHREGYYDKEKDMWYIGLSKKECENLPCLALKFVLFRRKFYIYWEDLPGEYWPQMWLEMYDRN